MHRWRSLLFIAATGCSWLPSDTPAKKPRPTDPDVAEIAHEWTVENHVLAGNAALTDADANENLGRKVVITPTSYRSMFVGSCDESARQKTDRVFADVLTELDLAGEARDTAIKFGFGDPMTEYRLTCPGNAKAVPLVIYISGKRAMTCAGGVCYLLSR
ncbi:MAG: hypothetical protein JO257_06905 [Deltaproteobacteria bacterium]|nr:hypothetical protein [Deltaproteobacteria bacterium]